MASRIFTKSPCPGMTLGQFHQNIIRAAASLNDKREARKKPPELATIYVGSLLKDPSPLSGISFLVSYSDRDTYAPKMVQQAITQAVREHERQAELCDRKWYEERGELYLS